VIDLVCTQWKPFSRLPIGHSGGQYAWMHLARAAQLQAELQQRKVAFDSKMKKAELVAALQKALSK
jgi:hypothetical protein